tara:strand:- start:15462 stop:17735 length:2274 start_codon:yes stop_codon:yes gene_type:complete
MTVQTSSNVATGIGNGVTTVFPVGYKFNEESDLVVLRIDDATSAAETLTLNSDYTVQGAGNEAGGSVTMAAPLAVGKTLTITRIVDILQLTDLRNQGKFFAEVHEDSFDKFIMIMQQLFQAVGDSLQLNAARNRWDAKGRRIINVGDPVDAQDAVTKSWLEAYITALVQSDIGPAQVAASVLYVAPSGDIVRVQDMSNASDPSLGAALLGRGVVAVASIADLLALPAEVRREDLRYLVKGYYAGTDIGGGEFYWDAASTAAANNGTIFGTGTGRFLRVISSARTMLSDWGAIPDTAELVSGTDNSPALQAALNWGLPVIIDKPPAGFAYGVDQVVLPRNANITGPGMYVLAIRGLTANATIIAGATSGELRREVKFRELYVENNRGGDAVNLEWCPDWSIDTCNFRSLTSTVLDTTAKRGLNLKNCERGQFYGQCRIGGNPALRMVKDCNGVRGDNVVLSGGSAGLALDISGCQNVRLPVTIETSLKGVRIGDNTGENLTDGGWCSGINLNDSYFESVGTPIVAGEGYAVSGLSLDECWLNNTALADSDPFPVSAEILRIGRVKSLSLKGGRWVGSGTETALRALDAVATSGSAAGQIELADVDLNVFENVAELLDLSGISNVSNRSIAAANNRIKTDKFGRGPGNVWQWTSDVLAANVTYGTATLTKVLNAGGRVLSVEVIEGNAGSLNGMRLRVGNTAAVGEILDKTFGAVSPVYEDQGVTYGMIRPGTQLQFRIDAGTGGGKFRVRITALLDNR